MENQENKEVQKTCSCKQDAKTFCIALLTAVIVVAIYHFGCGLYRIYCANPCGEGEFPVCQQYVLVPVQALPPCGAGCREDQGAHPRHHGEFRGERRMEKRMMKRRGMMPEGRRPEMKPEGKRPEMKQEGKRPEMPEPDVKPDKPAPEEK